MIDGFEIGHCTRDEPGWLTGTTVVLCREGAMGGVDVRGGGPGTRETDLLDPVTMIQQVHAVVLTGGSAYGLAAADGVMAGLEAEHIGFGVGTLEHQVVPIVPAAVIFDLNRGGEFAHRPDAATGAAALAAASTADPEQGCVGVGTGAVAGGLKGGFGYAETVTAQGYRVAAAVAVNAAGSVIDPATGRLYADRTHRLPDPTDEERTALAGVGGGASFATTIGVVMTDARLTKAQASKVAQVGHDGMARAIRPLHGMTDGDTVFCLSSQRKPLPEQPYEQVFAINDILSAGADAFTDACFGAITHAGSRGEWASWSELAPSTVHPAG
ncbi:MAG TPA: P1 family peptidase [Candidatus Avipropionibacterium avicola]|uniref:P1 family peptidase n=1 Tax=Candidatus Avipropionibacterium avicola TaxID=2840701 RepID=A0A9D1GY19_9ACTN|nr:P1 family peptidase [Candidatus Avipropionibacterium avicola]